MNSTRVLQTETPGGWINTKVTPEAVGQHLKPGFYNLFSAKRAEPGEHQGTVVHVDKDRVFQQVGKALIMHDGATFEKTPTVGKTYTLTASAGRTSLKEGQTQSKVRAI